ncbi:hypothetical protein ACP4OV_029394 [Aristida adscensionis]
MTVKPATPPARLLPLDSTNKSSSSSSSAGTDRKPSPAPAWTRAGVLRAVRYVSLYYLVNVIGVGVTVEGFRRLGAAGNVDLGARARATGVIAAGSCLRAAAAAVATVVWPTRFNLPVLECTAVSVAVAVYVVNAIDLC